MQERRSQQPHARPVSRTRGKEGASTRAPRTADWRLVLACLPALPPPRKDTSLSFGRGRGRRAQAPLQLSSRQAFFGNVKGRAPARWSPRTKAPCRECEGARRGPARTLPSLPPSPRSDTRCDPGGKGTQRRRKKRLSERSPRLAPPRPGGRSKEEPASIQLHC